MKRMKAIVITAPGEPEVLALTDVPDPEFRAGHVLVDVAATALNRADLLQRRGFYPAPEGESEILGLEFAGTVAALGPNTTGPVVGSRVMGLIAGGGYAERVSVHKDMLMPIPEALSFVQAGAIPEAFLTAFEALVNRGRVRAGESVLIHAAAGGVGTAAVQLAKQLGARVLATAGSAEKLAKVKELGADVTINYKTEDFAKVALEVSEQRGVDVILDFVGGAYWPKHAECLAIGGRNVVIGLMGGTSADVNLAQLLRRRYEIIGMVMRTRPLAEKIAITKAFSDRFLPQFQDGTLRPIIDSVLPLAEAAKAHAKMEANQNFGKIVLTP
jgi:putative PIG3 family NAD(P)H quinone oxidoreductase